MNANPDPQELARIKKGAGKDLQDVGETPDVRTLVEEKTIELERARAEIASLKQDIEERKKYAQRIFVLICIWVGGMFLLLVCEGLGGWAWLRFSLPVTVTLATIGSTTLNVLGLFYIVAHYLFPERGHQKHSSIKKPEH